MNKENKINPIKINIDSKIKKRINEILDEAKSIIEYAIFQGFTSKSEESIYISFDFKRQQLVITKGCKSDTLQMIRVRWWNGEDSKEIWDCMSSNESGLMLS